ncbi:MAG: hypothetical protein GY757_50105, partial [bacterium]|nr:hypothetical protein [bacterium]
MDTNDKLLRYSIAGDYWLQKLTSVTYNPLFGNKKNFDDTTPVKYEICRLPLPGGLAGKLDKLSTESDAKVFIV